MDFRRGKQEEPLEINLVPLIDVMMVILIFLMITTTYSKYTELQINLPTAESDKQLERPQSFPPAARPTRRMRPGGRNTVAERDQAAEHAHVGRAVGPERDGRVVVVVAEALAAEALVDRAAGAEVQCGQVPRVGARARAEGPRTSRAL